MLALEEQQAQLAEEKEQLQQEVRVLRAGAATQQAAVSQRDDQAELLANLVSIAQVCLAGRSYWPYGLRCKALNMLAAS